VTRLARARFTRVLFVAAGVMLVFPAGPATAHDGRHCFWYETDTAEVGVETDPVRVCAVHDAGGGGAPGGGGVGSAGGGDAPARIDAGAGGVAASTPGHVGWLSLGTVAAAGLLRRRRRP
jgi:hypothetical protein